MPQRFHPIGAQVFDLKLLVPHFLWSFGVPYAQTSSRDLLWSNLLCLRGFEKT